MRSPSMLLIEAAGLLWPSSDLLKDRTEEKEFDHLLSALGLVAGGGILLPERSVEPRVVSACADLRTSEFL